MDSTLAYGDTLADLGITLERESGNDVGEYKITGDASNENYDVTFTDGTYTIASKKVQLIICLLYTSPSPRDRQKSRMPSSA